MPDIVLQKSSNSAGTSAYAQMYAQQIVDHFSKTLEENGCLVQFPIALYVEFDNYENQLRDYIDAVIDEGSNSSSGRKPEDEVSQESPQTRDEAIRQAIRELNDKCFNCKIEKPKFDFSGIFNRLTFDIQHSLDEWKNMFKYNRTSVCRYAFFLSYLCVPDLLKLIALILAAIVRLMQNINLPRITVAIFISGIVAEIIKVLVKNISILARFALTPVLCILDALETIIDSLPTPENIKEVSERDLKKLGLYDKLNADTGLKKNIQDIRNAYTSRINDTEGMAQQKAQEIFGPLENTINQAVQSLQDSVTELSGLFNHFQCEPSRSGVSVSEFLSNASELMALANLLKYVIKFKAGKAAFDKVCNTPKGGADVMNNINNTGPLSIENVGSIIAETIGSDIDIIVGDDGKSPIGVVIHDDSEKNNSTLTFWNCNLKDFTDGISIPNIINETIINMPSVPNGEFKLGDWKVNIIPRTEYDPGARPDTRLIPLDIEEKWNIPQHIKLITDSIERYNPIDDGSIENDVIYMPDQVIEELIDRINNKSSNTNSDNNQNNRSIGYRAPNAKGATDTIGDSFSGNTSDDDKAEDGGTIPYQDKILSGLEVNPGRTINLECGTTGNILSRLGDDL